MPQPQVSVLINTYNGSRFIKKAIDSILSQSFQDFEIIIWDNKSTDDTKSKVQSISDKRIKYFYSNEHTSQYSARNTAIKKCCGIYIAFLDVDDWWHHEKLKKQIQSLQDENIGFSCTNAWIVDERRKYSSKKIAFKKIYYGNVLSNLLIQDFITMSSLVVKQSVLNNLDYIFHSNYEVIGDFDLVLRLSTITELSGINEPLTYYRWHHNNLRFKKIKTNSLELCNLLDQLKKNKRFYQNENFENFEGNITLNKYIVMILENNRYLALKGIKKFRFNKYLFKLIISLLLPKFLIKKIRYR